MFFCKKSVGSIFEPTDFFYFVRSLYAVNPSGIITALKGAPDMPQKPKATKLEFTFKSDVLFKMLFLQ